MAELDLQPPGGFYSSLLECFDASRSMKTNACNGCYEIYPAETFGLQKPTGIDSRIHPKFHNDSFSKQHAFVAILPEGRYWGSNGKVGAIIAADNKLVWDASFLFGRTAHKHPVFKQRNLSPATYTEETVAILTFAGGTNYYHWMFDVLPRFDLLRKSKLKIDKYIVNNNGPVQYQYDTLKAIGLTGDKIIQTYKGIHLRAKRLAVPSMVVPAPPSSRAPSRWACDYLRMQFLDKQRARRRKGYERIYISRADAGHRRVLNEDMVMQVLERYGFKKVVLKTMSVADQVQLFYNADVVVAPHGAGLTNLVFCRPGTKVVEIYSPKHMNPCYWYLSNHVNLDYYYIIGKKLSQHPESVERGDPIVVNLDDLSKIVKLAGI